MLALVTGGAGFVGSHVVDRLLKEGMRVRVLDSLHARVHPRGLPGWFPAQSEYLRGSITDEVAVRRALEGVDVVFHQAAYQDYMTDFSQFARVNVAGVSSIYEWVVRDKLPVRKVIVASSQAVYGEGQFKCSKHGFFLPRPRSREQLQKGEWEIKCPQCGSSSQPMLLEEDYPNPFNQYAVSKYAGERMALGLGWIYQIPSVALRYSITQGPRQSLYNQYSGICRIFSSRLRKGLPPIIYEDGLQTRDFVHVSDVVEANLQALQDTRMDFQAFNVGSGVPMTVLSYADKLCQAINPRLKPEVRGEYRVGDNRHSVSSIRKLQDLGWKPTKTLDDIVCDFLTWVDTMGGIPDEVFEAETIMRDSGVVQRVAAAEGGLLKPHGI
jgi:dTDP-L-rhamnose 4-epimerase